MNLVIDLGNSRIKWASADGTALNGHGAADYDGDGVADVLDATVRLPRTPSRVWVASVAHAGAEAALAQWLKASFGLEPTMVRARSAGFGVTSAYPEPGQLGADRWAALIGAHHAGTEPACIVDCGTAVTMDVLTEGGRHHGGLIAPGHLIMRRALYGATARIADEGDGRQCLPAVDTRSAVMAGTQYAAAAFVERAHSEFERSLGRRLPCLITGGELDVLRPLLRMETTVTRHLVLEGLAVVARESE